MARAMRPVVVLMLLATVLFIVDGVLDHNYANQPLFDEYKGVGWTSFVFAVANLLMTIAVARGSERTLLGRIALSAFFIVERPLTAFVLGPKPITSVAVHMATAVVELVILIGAIRVWRLGHSLVPADMDAVFALDSAGPRPDATLPVSEPALPVPPPEEAPAPGTGGSAWIIGLLTLLLAAILVADGAIAGFIPGGRDWGTSGDSSGWLTYLFAVVILTVATRAVHGGSVAQRLLLMLALIFFVERAFSPFVLKVSDPVQLGLHGLAAFVALALALATANAIRGGGRKSSSRRASPAT
ncbi:MAG TPA: hypothetical protein VGT60_03005 [Candidatus Limnocylindria bacterium]|nr:hypothetical protein [Candidatus Limnocylindria bacterium]